MVSFFGTEFDRVVKWAKRYSSFRLRTIAGLRDFAVVRDVAGEWLITIERKQDISSAIDSLLHECAHIIDWQANGYTDDHGKQHRRSWGIIYSDLYRAYHAAAEKGKI
jgi:hypothetical protein